MPKPNSLGEARECLAQLRTQIDEAVQLEEPLGSRRKMKLGVEAHAKLQQFRRDCLPDFPELKEDFGAAFRVVLNDLLTIHNGGDDAVADTRG